MNPITSKCDSLNALPNICLASWEGGCMRTRDLSLGELAKKLQSVAGLEEGAYANM